MTARPIRPPRLRSQRASATPAAAASATATATAIQVPVMSAAGYLRLVLGW